MKTAETLPLTELFELLHIPSVSTGESNVSALGKAAQWLVDYVRGAGGACDLIVTEGNPLVVGELRAGQPDSPTVMIYGHYDVQSPGAMDAWQTPPFEPEVRNGRIYGRGASDDKGNFFPLLYVACRMAKEGTLPVNVRVLVEGEEEVGSRSVMHWIDADERGADCAIVFDSGSPHPELNAITIAARGVIMLDVTVTTADRDLHSGLYGGVVPNALHELMDALEPVLPDPQGRLKEELREGIIPVSSEERRSWEKLPPGDVAISQVGGRPLSAEVAAEYYLRNWADASIDVNEIRGGEPRTVIPAKASAHLTMRVAPGQQSDKVKALLTDLVRNGVRKPAEVEIVASGVDAAYFDPESEPLRLARQAFKNAFGEEPLLTRIGGTIPILDSFAKREIPAIVTGFARADDTIHAPNESYALKSLAQGVAASEQLYLSLGDLTIRR